DVTICSRDCRGRGRGPHTCRLTYHLERIRGGHLGGNCLMGGDRHPRQPAPVTLSARMTTQPRLDAWNHFTTGRCRSSIWPPHILALHGGQVLSWYMYKYLITSGR